MSNHLKPTFAIIFNEYKDNKPVAWTALIVALSTYFFGENYPIVAPAAGTILGSFTQISALDKAGGTKSGQSLEQMWPPMASMAAAGNFLGLYFGYPVVGSLLAAFLQTYTQISLANVDVGGKSAWTSSYYWGYVIVGVGIVFLLKRMTGGGNFF